MDEPTHDGLPVEGYAPQSQAAVDIVNVHKRMEERWLRLIEAYQGLDPRWVAIAKTHIEQGFMALNRAVFKPGRVALPEDEAPSTQAEADAISSATGP